MPGPDTELVPTSTALEKSYSRRLGAYAWHETREHKKVELIASCIGGVAGGIAAIALVGFTWTGVAAAIVCGAIGLVTALACIFLFNLIYSPKALDEKQRLEIAELNTSKAELESRLAAHLEGQFEWGETLRKINQQHIDDIYTLHQRDISALKTDYENEIAALKSSHNSQIKELTGHKVKTHVIREGSQVYVTPHSTWETPVVRAQIALRFENVIANDVSLVDLNLLVCERGDGNDIRVLPLRGRKPDTLRSKPKLTHYYDPADEVEIAGFVVKGHAYSPKYFFIDDDMIVDPHDRNSLDERHFLRLVLSAVAQKPYMVDIEVDWTQPGAYIKSWKPVTDED